VGGGLRTPIPSLLHGEEVFEKAIPLKFGNLYKSLNRPAFSFEIFPPKNQPAMERLAMVLPRLKALQPDLMTVTYGALGATRARTLDTAMLVRKWYGMDTACHLTCVGSSRADLDGILDRIRDSRIKNIVALRGDPPKGEAANGFVPPPDGCRFANELVDHIHDYERRRGCEPFGIAVAGYPEIHAEAPDAATDLVNLKRKVDAGVSAVISQLFFDNRDFHAFVERARAAGIDVPIIPGLMPIGSAKQIKTMTEMCGAKIPAELAAQLDAAGDDPVANREVGVRHCLAQARELLSHGVPGIHFYVLNRADHMERIMTELRKG
jgi:methylenetetrahydrofolate reductase (NADPH)